jgi:hypothetical protein
MQDKRFVSGIQNGVTTAASSQLSVQPGTLPELLLSGQAGSDPSSRATLSLTNVAALFSTHGGLDISLYSAGMVCVDLLSRMQVVLDYTNKRIGWLPPPPTSGV